MRVLLMSGLLIALSSANTVCADPPMEQDGETTERIGLSDFGQTTILDNLFNPAISFVGDFALSWSEKRGRQAGADGFKLRSAELGIFGAVDDVLEYHGIVFFDDEEIELEEAYVVAREWLPDRCSLKGGRYNIDFGKQAAVHDHDLPTLDKPSVLQEFIGGTVRGTGAELHWWSPLGEDSLFRTSLGILQSADSDAHVILGPGAGHHHEEEEGGDESPIRDIKDFAVSLRATSLVDVSDSTTVQVGASFLYAPMRVFGVGIFEEEVDHTVAGVDVTVISQDDETGKGYRFQAEYLMNDQDFSERDDMGTPDDTTDDLFTVANQDSTGLYALFEIQQNKDWSYGASANIYEHAEDSKEKSSDVGVFVTRRVNEFNRVRFEVRGFEDLAFEDDGVEEKLDFFAFSVQWTVILGSHGHGLEW